MSHSYEEPPLDLGGASGFMTVVPASYVHNAAAAAAAAANTSSSSSSSAPSLGPPRFAPPLAAPSASSSSASSSSTLAGPAPRFPTASSGVLTRLRDLRQGTRKANVMGVVASNLFMVATRGTGWKSALCIVDEDFVDTSVPVSSSGGAGRGAGGGFGGGGGGGSRGPREPLYPSMQYFGPGNGPPGTHPRPLFLGDVVRGHRVDVEVFNGRLQINVPSTWGGYVTVHHQDGTISSTCPNPVLFPAERQRAGELKAWWAMHVLRRTCLLPRDLYFNLGAAIDGVAAYTSGGLNQFPDILACVVSVSEDMRKLRNRLLVMEGECKALDAARWSGGSSSNAMAAIERLSASVNDFRRDPYAYLGVDPTTSDFSLFIWDGTDPSSGARNPYAHFGIGPPDKWWREGLGQTVVRLRIDNHQLEIARLCIEPGDWVRARNIKFRPDTGPAGYAPTPTSPLQAYLGDIGGMLKVPSPEQVRDVVELVAGAHAAAALAESGAGAGVAAGGGGVVGGRGASASSSSSSSSSMSMGVGMGVGAHALVVPAADSEPPQPQPMPGLHMQQAAHPAQHRAVGAPAAPAFGARPLAIGAHTTTAALAGPSAAAAAAAGVRGLPPPGHGAAEAEPDMVWATRVLAPELPFTSIADLVAAAAAGLPAPGKVFVHRVRAIPTLVFPFDHLDFCRPVPARKVSGGEDVGAGAGAAAEASGKKRARSEDVEEAGAADVSDVTPRLRRTGGQDDDDDENVFGAPASAIAAHNPARASVQRQPLGAAPASNSSSSSTSTPVGKALAEVPSHASHFYHFAIRLRDIDWSETSTRPAPILDALVFGPDAETFLPGLPPCDLRANTETAADLARRMRQLIRPGAAMDCCLKVYRAAGDGPVRFRVCRTVLMPPPVRG
jgi:hypothetical protein